MQLALRKEMGEKKKMITDIIIMVLVHIGGIFAGLNIGYDMGQEKAYRRIREILIGDKNDKD